LPRAHEGGAGPSAVDSATRWGRLLAAVAGFRFRSIRLGADAGARAAIAAAPASYGVIAKHAALKLRRFREAGIFC